MVKHHLGHLNLQNKLKADVKSADSSKWTGKNAMLLQVVLVQPVNFYLR